MTSQAAYHPFRDPALSLAEKVERGPTWISNYFPPIRDLDDVTSELVISRAPQDTFLASDPTKTPTLARMSPQELDTLVDRAALVHSSLLRPACALVRFPRELRARAPRHARHPARRACAGALVRRVVRRLSLGCEARHR
ncbi:hypothetical protein PsYK624_078010 [Phanerochaete sordida]|uniref:Uncharacterized protein n=1 Tax=Phanerochaete sordida TaxID=48140 RepID=A0A9P3GBC4_9APHY|nr:hypothetical protein PsYK624_078010 [Phanerochaete sordida]